PRSVSGTDQQIRIAVLVDVLGGDRHELCQAGAYRLEFTSKKVYDPRTTLTRCRLRNRRHHPR
ncbi:MAG: hypothetical protein AAF492_17875, partial [Verrucomicrobiota bacterium]